MTYQGRYKGVWSSGHTEGTVQAAEVLRRFVTAGGRFSFDASDAFIRNTLALRLGDRVVVPDTGAIIAGMKMLLEVEVHTP